ncbi:MAG: AAA family ATPase [Alphaproteobacteria bacterium]|nr:AAA family ATPase [Alphaproteobacteria bacterium]
MKKVKITNIKGIKSLEAKFNKTENLIFAKNGTGKSTISSCLYLISKLQELSQTDNKEEFKNQAYQDYNELFKKLRPIKNWGNSKIEIEFISQSLIIEIEFNNEKIIDISDSSKYQKSPKLHVYCDDFLNTLSPSFSKSGAFKNMVEANITKDDTELENKEIELASTEKKLNNILGKTKSDEDDEEKGFTKDLVTIYNQSKGDPKKYWNNIKSQIYDGNIDGLEAGNPSDIQKKLEELDEISVDSIEIEKQNAIQINFLPDELCKLIENNYPQIDTVLENLGSAWCEKSKDEIDNENHHKCPLCEQNIDVELRKKTIKRLKGFIDSDRAKAQERLEYIESEIKKIKPQDIMKKITKNIGDTKDQRELLTIEYPLVMEPSLEDHIKRIEQYQTDIVGNEGDKKGLIKEKLDKQMDIKIATSPLKIKIEHLTESINGFNKDIINKYNEYVECLKTEAGKKNNNKANLNKKWLSSKLCEKINEHKNNGTYKTIKDLKKIKQDLDAEIKKLSVKHQEQVNFLMACKDIFNNLLTQLGCKKFKINDSGKLVLSETEIDNNHKNILSTGEKNIISLAYYWISSLEKVKNVQQARNIIFVMDDPVSSVDYHNFYNLTSSIEYYKQYLSKYRYDKIGKGFYNENDSWKNNKRDSLILTHDTTFYTFIRQNIFKDGGGYFELKRENDGLELNQSNFSKESMLKLHLKDICSFIKPKNDENNENVHTIGNSIRCVLEIAQDIQCREENLGDFIQSINNGVKLKQVANSLSHGKFTDEASLNKQDDLEEICKEVIKFFEEKHSVDFTKLKTYKN